MKPQARKNGLVVKELSDEVLVYDLERHQAHCLNRGAALVFKHSDGKTSVGEMVGLFERELGAADERLVWLALDQLGKAGLLEERLTTPPEARRRSRRDMIRRMGVGVAALLPLVTSIVAPTPVEAAATCVTMCAGYPFGQPCTPDCFNNYCDGFGNCL